MPKSFIGKSATASMGAEKQNLETVARAIGRILKMSGCPNCGRIAKFKFDFIVDPPADLARDGVTSFESQGF